MKTLSTLFGATALIACSFPALAQPGGQAMQVGATAAISLELADAIVREGTIASRNESLVAAEVSGKVRRLAVRAGDPVTRGAVLVELDAGRLRQQRAAQAAAVAEAEARLELARLELERLEELIDSGIISPRDVDAARAEQAAWGGRVAGAEARLAELDEDLEDATIRAPFAGVVTAEHVQVGEWLGVGGAVLELVDTRDLELLLEIPERDYGHLDRSAAVTVEIPSLDLLVDGRLAAVIPRAETGSRTFLARIRFTNPGRVGVGMLGRARIGIGESHPAVAVPKDAITTQGHSRVVHKIVDGSPQMVTVEIGLGSGDWVAVTGDLAVGDLVITRGNERIFPGMTVEPNMVDYPVPGTS